MDRWEATIKAPSRLDIIKYAVNNHAWQKFRLSLKGRTTSEKLIALHNWLHDAEYSHAARVQVDNYLGALKRGGQLSAKGVILK